MSQFLGAVLVSFAPLLLGISSTTPLAPTADMAEDGPGISTGWATLAQPKIVGHGTYYKLPAGFLGLNVVNAINGKGFPAWDDPLTASWIAAFNATSLRYPGGTVGNYWDWQRGVRCDKKQAAPDSLASFAALAQTTNTSPTYVLNVLSTGDDCAIVPAPANEDQMISDQTNLLQQAGEDGLKTKKYIELGNEFYLNQADYITRFPCTAADCAPGDSGKADDNAGATYGNDMKSWLAALRGQFPNASIGVVGFNNTWNGVPRNQNWNQGVLSTGTGADALIIHDYTTVTSPSTKPPALIARVFEDWTTIQAELDAMTARGIPTAWITEWNFTDKTDSDTFTGSWLTGLADFQHLVDYLTDSRVTRTMAWNLSNPTASDSLVYWPGQSYQIGGISYTIPPEGTLSASGAVIAFVGQGLTGVTKVASITTKNIPMISGTGFKSYPTITGVKLYGPDHEAYLLSNYSGTPLTVAAPSIAGGTIRSLSAPSLMTYITPDAPPATATSDFEGPTFSLPAYSVNLVVTH